MIRGAYTHLKGVSGPATKAGGGRIPRVVFGLDRETKAAGDDLGAAAEWVEPDRPSWKSD